MIAKEFEVEYLSFLRDIQQSAYILEAQDKIYKDMQKDF